MRITAFNGSPKQGTGNTGMMLEEIQKGVLRAGGEYEIINLGSIKLMDCKGCFTCWNKNNGYCVIKDDMQAMLQKIRESDIILLGSPIYYHNVTILMKRFLERLMPLTYAPMYKNKEGLFCHYCEEGLPKIGMVSSCNLPDYSNFDIISLYARTIAKHLNTELIAEIYRTEASAFKTQYPQLEILLNRYKETWEQAGYELVTIGGISERVAVSLNRTLIKKEFYVQNANELAEAKKMTF